MESWESSNRRTMAGGWVDPGELPRGPSGRPLCRWCQLEVPKGRRTFCSEFCVNEWRMRTSPGYLRELVFERDHGVCAACGVDTEAELRRLKRSRGANRKVLLGHWGLDRLWRRSLWDADHILPVAEGGGECDLDNIRTLCLKCHHQATVELRKRLNHTPGRHQRAPGR